VTTTMEIRGSGTSNWDQENPFSSIDVVEIKGFSFFPRPMLVGAPSGSDSEYEVLGSWPWPGYMSLIWLVEKCWGT